MADDNDISLLEKARRKLPSSYNKATRPILEGEERIAPAVRGSREYARGQMKGAAAGSAATLAAVLAPEIIKNKPPAENYKSVEEMEREIGRAHV